MKLICLLLTCCATVAVQRTAQAANEFDPDINVGLMKCTFRLHGPSKDEPGKEATGTAFLLGRPFNGQPPTGEQKGRFVLVTAAHVLQKVAGNIATLDLRTCRDGNWTTTPVFMQIRDAGKPQWVEHPQQDVAVMYPGQSIPKVFWDSLADVSVVPTSLIADDAKCEDWNVTTGTELFTLGFPHGLCNEGGFPILRGGRIASYPILPMKRHRTFAFDFEVYGGNSGGPVYFHSTGPFFDAKGNMKLASKPVQFLMGLVTAQVQASEKEQIKLGVVISSAAILETIELLPNDTGNPPQPPKK